MLGNATTVQYRSTLQDPRSMSAMLHGFRSGRRAATAVKLSPVTVKKFNVAPNGDPPPLTLWGEDA